MDIEAAAILRRARELIGTEEKWLKGDLGGNGKYCALGALHMAAFGSVCSPDSKPKGATIAYLTLQKVMGGNITGRNNRFSTTHTDVLTDFDRAIALAEGKDYAAPQGHTLPVSEEFAASPEPAGVAPRPSDAEYTRQFVEKMEHLSPTPATCPD